MSTPTDIAAALQCVEYGAYCITADIQERARAAGLVIVCGASDDLMELYGAIREEVGCYDGGTVTLDARGVIPSWEEVQDDEERARDYFARKDKARTIEALWSPAEPAGASWAYRTDLPHATFNVMEDGEIYCRGIVFAVADLTAPAAA